MATQVPLLVEMDGGDSFTVIADQRDLAAAEAQDGIADTLFARLRFIGWNAARRAGRYAGTWEAWNTKDCVEVDDRPDAVAAQDGDGLDPGRPDQSAAS